MGSECACTCTQSGNSRRAKAVEFFACVYRVQAGRWRHRFSCWSVFVRRPRTDNRWKWRPPPRTTILYNADQLVKSMSFGTSDTALLPSLSSVQGHSCLIPHLPFFNFLLASLEALMQHGWLHLHVEVMPFRSPHSDKTTHLWKELLSNSSESGSITDGFFHTWHRFCSCKRCSQCQTKIHHCSDCYVKTTLVVIQTGDHIR